MDKVSAEVLSQIIQPFAPLAPGKQGELRGFVFFDAGNVLFDIDLDTFRNTLADLVSPRLAGTPATRAAATAAARATLTGFELGKTGPAACLEAMREALGYRGDPEDGPPPEALAIKDLFNAIILGVRPGVLALARTLREMDFGVGVFSNTSPWHEVVLEREGRLTECFDAVVYSHDIGARKPAPQSYAAAAAEANRWAIRAHGKALTPRQLHFVDDLPENVVAANAQGWQARLVVIHKGLDPWRTPATDQLLERPHTRDLVQGDEGTRRVRWLFSRWLGDMA